jgi:isopenicillin-N N-acyltransferase-like protein
MQRTGITAAERVRPRRIELLRVAGSHAEVGEQIGAACGDVVRAVCGRITPAAIAAAESYHAVTRRELPWLVEELDGVARGAGLEPMSVFAAGIEELDEPVAGRPARGCSDLVCGPSASADGRLWVAHTNDLSAATEEQLIAIEWRLPGDPVLFTVGVGPWISVGFNSAGLALTGNELTPNDNRIGIPRLLHVRDILRRRTLDEAVEAALSPHRASSYNTILSHREGGVVNVEGSATDAELMRPGPDGTLAHTNHYVSARMLPYEGDPEYAAGSAVRYRRALEWLAPGQITEQVLRCALQDHTGAPHTLCRHLEHGAQSKTVFWCLADVTEGAVTYGRGNPCDSLEQRYAFD